MGRVAVEKVSLSFEPELARRAREAAEASGRSLSAFVAEAVEYRLKLEAGRRLLEEGEAEHGAISEKERAGGRARWRGCRWEGARWTAPSATSGPSGCAGPGARPAGPGRVS